MHQDTFPSLERDAFSNACRRHGFIAADFSITEGADEDPSGVRLVSVLRPETGVSMVYAAGRGNFWPTEFEHDLMTHAFGSSPD